MTTTGIAYHGYRDHGPLVSVGDVPGIVWPYSRGAGLGESSFKVEIGDRPELYNYISGKYAEHKKQRVILTVTRRTVELVPGLLVDHHLIVDARPVPDEPGILSVMYGERVRDQRMATVHGYVIHGRLVKHHKLEYAKELYATTVVGARLGVGRGSGTWVCGKCGKPKEKTRFGSALCQRCDGEELGNWEAWV